MLTLAGKPPRRWPPCWPTAIRCAARRSDLTLRKRALEGGRDDDANRGDARAHPGRGQAAGQRGLRVRPAPISWPEMAALAYPDRIGLRRPGDAPRYVLSGGKGAVLPEADPLAATRLIVAPDLDGDPREARIRQAAALTEAELRGLYADRIGWQQTCEWSRRDGRVVAREQEVFGALVLADRIWNDAPPEAIARAALDGIRDLGLPFDRRRPPVSGPRRTGARQRRRPARHVRRGPAGQRSRTGCCRIWPAPGPPPTSAAST